MEQIPLRGPDDGAISLHPLGTLCLAQVLQFSLHPFSMWAEGVKWKLTHLQALAMEIALKLGYTIKYYVIILIDCILTNSHPLWKYFTDDQMKIFNI